MKLKTLMVGSTGCLVHCGTLNNGGYGPHRAAWVAAGRELIEGMDLDHLCRNRWCVNVDHLEQVTRKENLNRGKQSSRQDESKCRNGLHDWTEEATFIDSHGKTRCRACHKVSQAKYLKKLKEEQA